MEHKLTVEMLDSEYWWGGAVHDGVHMPLHSGSDFSRNLYTHETSNQIMGLLLSNKGRYIWSDMGFSFAANHGVL